jgi:hypothetical protein
MPPISDLLIYICFIGWGTYCILIVPYFGSKILQKSGETERFWFFILVLFNFLVLLFILLRPKFREQIGKPDLRKLELFAIGYVVLFIGTITIIESIDILLS